MKKKIWLGMEKISYNQKKHFIINIRNYFHLENFVSFLALSWYKKLLLIFFYFMLGFKKFASQIKSAFISCYEKFFILHLIISHPEV